MAAPVQIAPRQDAGVDLFYLPPGNQPPNIFASFWQNYLAARSPYAQKAYASALAGQSPKEQYAALAAIAKAREARMTEEDKNWRAQLASDTQVSGQGHADYRSQLAWDSAIKSSTIRGNASITSSKIGRDAELIKAGTLDRPAQEILGNYRTEMEGAQRDLNDALGAGDEAGAKAAVLAMQEATANARSTADNLPPMQQDALSRAVQSQPLIVSDPDLQDVIRGIQGNAFGAPPQIEAPDYGGVGYSGGPPAPAGAPDTTISRSRSISERMSAPSTSAGPPGSTLEQRQETPSTAASSGAPIPATTTPRKPAEAPTGSPGPSSSSTEFDDLESKVESVPRPDPANFNFFAPGFGLGTPARRGSARAAPGREPPSRASAVADRLRSKPDVMDKPAGEKPVDLYPERKAPTPANQTGTFRPGWAPAGAAGPAKPIGPAKPAASPKRPQRPAAKVPAAAPAKAGVGPAPGGGPGAGDVKVRESRPDPGGGAGDVKTRESRPEPGGGMGDVKAAEAEPNPSASGPPMKRQNGTGRTEEEIRSMVALSPAGQIADRLTDRIGASMRPDDIPNNGVVFPTPFTPDTINSMATRLADMVPRGKDSPLDQMIAKRKATEAAKK